MATSLWNGNLLNIYISTDNGVTKKLAVCMTSGEISVETNVIDATSKCDDGYTGQKPGNKSWSISGEGFSNRDAADSGQLSLRELMSIWQADTQFLVYWKDAAGSYRNYNGSAFLTSITETAATDELVQFSFEIQGTGTLSLS